jgi:heme/copper-type cytochrome/quinol oxidase subunit 1
VPRAIGGRLYSDTMGRVAFALFLVFSMPIGIHHLFADPQVGAGFKFVHAAMTAMVSVPTLLTVFTIVASVEIAARLRGGKGLFGWVKALPWDNPMMLALVFSFVMLGFGGAGGIINMSYQLNETVHNTQWVTGHFHLIFAGAIVIMYFMVAYELWPQLTDCGALPQGLMKLQLWLWFIRGTSWGCWACRGAWLTTTTATRISLRKRGLSWPPPWAASCWSFPRSSSSTSLPSLTVGQRHGPLPSRSVRQLILCRIRPSH